MISRIDYIDLIILAAPTQENLLTGGYLFNANLASALEGREELRYILAPPQLVAEEVLDLVRGSGTAVVVFDSLFFGVWEMLEPLLSEPRISACILLIHSLPSSNPLLSEKEKEAWEAREGGLLERVRGCCVPSRFVAHQLEKRGIPRGHIEVCPPGVDRKLLSAGRKAESAKLSRESSEAVRILTVARWDPAKGLFWLLESLEELEALRWEWDLVGDTQVDPDYAHRFRSALEESPLRGRTRIHGIQEPEAVRSHLEKADLFALASLTESYGMVFAEALAAGVPAVGNRVGGVPEIVQDGVTGLLCSPLSRKEWRRSLERLITSAESRKTMREAAMVEGKRLPCWEETAARFLRSVRSLSGETVGSSG